MSPDSTVVKRQYVQATGRRRVGPQSAAPPSAAKKVGGGAAARVVEQDETGALIEVTCPCGQKVYVHCDYAPTG
jgi:hypothetical protein